MNVNNGAVTEYLMARDCIAQFFLTRSIFNTELQAKKEAELLLACFARHEPPLDVSPFETVAQIVSNRGD